MTGALKMDRIGYTQYMVVYHSVIFGEEGVINQFLGALSLYILEPELELKSEYLQTKILNPT